MRSRETITNLVNRSPRVRRSRGTRSLPAVVLMVWAGAIPTEATAGGGQETGPPPHQTSHLVALSEGTRPPGLEWQWVERRGRALDAEQSVLVERAQAVAASLWTEVVSVDWAGLSNVRDRSATKDWRPRGRAGDLRPLGIARDAEGNWVVALFGERLPSEVSIVHRWLTVYVRLGRQGVPTAAWVGVESEVRE